jgi:threonine dehydrogenase-like Zn-dependent dehydrogenase
METHRLEQKIYYGRFTEEAGMKALRWYGKEDVRVEKVRDPEIIDPTDAIIKITATAICGSDLHLYDA